MNSNCKYVRAFFCLTFLVLAAPVALAKAVSRSPQSVIPKKGNAQWAEVKSSAAMVFDSPDFDADVLAYLQEGQRIAVSKKAFGPFRKVRLEDNRVGYVSMADVKIQNTYASAGRKPASTEAEEDEAQDNEKGKKSHKKNPYYDDSFRKDISDGRYVGGFATYNQVTQTYKGTARTGGQGFYGMRYSSGSLLPFAPFLSDINIGFSLGPPSYYSIGAESSSGYAIWTDFTMLLPLAERKEFMWYIGGGPMLGYQSYKVISGRQIYNYDDIKFGADILTGVGVRVGRVLARFDIKYWFEGSSYPGITLSVQHQF